MPRRIRLRFPTLCLALATLLASTTAVAEEGATLERAEAAYAGVDFEATHTLSRDALAAGGNEPAATLRLYTLLGIAAAALGDDAAARDAFRHVIAIDPAVRLDKTLSPKLRSPFLETRGQLTASGELAPLRARLLRTGGTAELTLSDPAGVAHVIDVTYRADEKQAFTRAHLRPDQTRILAPDVRPKQLEYSLVVRDAHGNALFRHGTEQEPARLSIVPRRRSGDKPEQAPVSNGGYYLTAGLLAGAGVAAGGVGAYFHVRREKAAREWNGATCEQPGGTRGTLCEEVNDRRASAEQLAVGLYAGGGALLIGSLVALLVAPGAEAASAKERATLPCVPSVAPAGAACSLSF
jgi:hypothetical protein